MRTRWSTLSDTLAEVEAVTLGDIWGDAHAVVETLDDTLAEMEAKTLGETRGDAFALVDTLASRGSGGLHQC